MDVCVDCTRKITNKDKLLTCGVCCRKSHISCQNITKTEYTTLQKQMAQLHWYCKSCKIGAESLHKQMIFMLGKISEVEKRMTALEDKINVSATEIDNKIDDIVRSKLDMSHDKLREEVMDAVTKKIESNLAERAELQINEVRVTGIAAELAKDTRKGPESYTMVIKEIEDREKRKNNLIIHGLSESKEEKGEKKKDDDRKRCIEILKVVHKDIDTTECSKFYRIGKFDNEKSRPIIIQLQNEEIKGKILKEAKNLKGSQYEQIGISHDLTKQQRLELQEYLKEARQKSAGGTKHRVTGMPGFWQVREVKKETLKK